MGRASIYSIAISLVALLTSGCAKTRVVVASKNFTEQVLLGELVAAQIERRTNIEVDRTLNLGGTLLAHEALKSGSIDLYPEYTGTALTAVLHDKPVTGKADAFVRVQQGYRQWGLEWLPPLGFNDSFAMVVRTETARAETLRTLSDAARRPWKLGVGYEFVQRPDGLAGLVRMYGLKVEGDPVTMDLGLLYQALQSRKVDMAAANATDGVLANQEFTVLEDDRQYFPPYECSLVVREETMRKFPQLRAALAELSGRISDAAMRRMNEQVDVKHRPAAEVAREFLGTIR